MTLCTGYVHVRVDMESGRTVPRGGWFRHETAAPGGQSPKKQTYAARNLSSTTFQFTMFQKAAM